MRSNATPELAPMLPGKSQKNLRNFLKNHWRDKKEKLKENKSLFAVSKMLSQTLQAETLPLAIRGKIG
jgi:hypothetical protein